MNYPEATVIDLMRVVHAADRLYQCIAEFPEDPEMWGESMQELDAAVEACPGTNAYFCKQAMLKEAKAAAREGV